LVGTRFFALVALGRYLILELLLCLLSARVVLLRLALCASRAFQRATEETVILATDSSAKQHSANEPAKEIAGLLGWAGQGRSRACLWIYLVLNRLAQEQASCLTQHGMIREFGEGGVNWRRLRRRLRRGLRWQRNLRD
jgi:hypothetical protein